jgi:hypothetical protein
MKRSIHHVGKGGERRSDVQEDLLTYKTQRGACQRFDAITCRGIGKGEDSAYMSGRKVVIC